MLTRTELDSLLKTRELLATAVHVSDPYATDSEIRGSLFNMNQMAQTFDCGTVFCIGGWMKVFQDNLNPKELTFSEQSAVEKYVSQGGDNKTLRALFYPPDDVEYDYVTPAHAIKAIDNFLEFGDPKWMEICDVDAR